MYCPKCGNHVDEGDVFCKKCGYRLIVDRKSIDFDESSKTQLPKNSLPIKNKFIFPHVDTPKMFKKHPILTVIFVIVLLAEANSIINPDDANKNSKKQSTTASQKQSKMFQSGVTYHLIDNSVVIKNYEDIAVVESLIQSKDSQGLYAMIKQGKVYLIQGETPCNVVGEGTITGYASVLINGGRNVNKTGFVAIPFIK